MAVLDICVTIELSSDAILHLSCRFFQHLNSEIFRCLIEVSRSEDHVMTLEMVDALGLDPSRDRLFLIELASLHNLNVTVQQQKDMFSCCI